MNNCLFVVLYSISCAAVFRILQAVLPECATCFYNFTACVLLSSIVAYFFYPIVKRKYFDAYVLPHNKAVFITGCDTGFGHELAKRLDTKGYIVFASCLFPEGEGAKKLKEVSSSRLHILGLDVSKDESVQEAVEYVKKNIGNAEFWALVNNAGILKGFDVAMTKIDDFSAVLNVNTLGTVRTTKAFLPMLMKTKGRVVCVTSLASRLCLPHMAAYNMSKYASRAFCETLRQEMYPWGVRVIEIEPEAFKTEIVDRKATMSRYDKLVEEFDPELKEDYGDIYFKEFLARILQAHALASPRIYKVIEKLEDAVSLFNPCDVYIPCRSGIFYPFLFLWKNTPVPFINNITGLCKWFYHYPIPRKAGKSF